jgi:hypothetical protein
MPGADPAVVARQQQLMQGPPGTRISAEQAKAAIEADMQRRQAAEQQRQNLIFAQQEEQRRSAEAARESDRQRAEGLKTAPLTAEQLAAAANHQRMTSASPIITKYDGAPTAMGNLGQALSGVPIVGGMVASPERSAYNAAQNEWLAASGNAANPKAMEEARQRYFPQINEGPEVVKQKAQARQTAEDAMLGRAGPNYKPPAGPASAGLVRISGDAEYNQLKPGTAYVGPDGIPRTK